MVGAGIFRLLNTGGLLIALGGGCQSRQAFDATGQGFASCLPSHGSMPSQVIANRLQVPRPPCLVFTSNPFFSSPAKARAKVSFETNPRFCMSTHAHDRLPLFEPIYPSARAIRSFISGPVIAFHAGLRSTSRGIAMNGPRLARPFADALLRFLLMRAPRAPGRRVPGCIRATRPSDEPRAAGGLSGA